MPKKHGNSTAGNSKKHKARAHAARQNWKGGKTNHDPQTETVVVVPGDHKQKLVLTESTGKSGETNKLSTKLAKEDFYEVNPSCRAPALSWSTEGSRAFKSSVGAVSPLFFLRSSLWHQVDARKTHGFRALDISQRGIPFIAREAMTHALPCPYRVPSSTLLWHPPPSPPVLLPCAAPNILPPCTHSPHIALHLRPAYAAGALPRPPPAWEVELCNAPRGPP